MAKRENVVQFFDELNEQRKKRKVESDQGISGYFYADFVTAQVKALSFLAFFKSHKVCIILKLNLYNYILEKFVFF